MDAALDDRRYPEDTLVRFVSSDAEFGDELVSRTSSAGRPIVSRNAHACSQELAPDFAALPGVGQAVLAESQDAEPVTEGALPKCFSGVSHAATQLQSQCRGRVGD